jgi:hypothetical protein
MNLFSRLLPFTLRQARYHSDVLLIPRDNAITNMDTVHIVPMLSVLMLLCSCSPVMISSVRCMPLLNCQRHLISSSRQCLMTLYPYLLLSNRQHHRCLPHVDHLTYQQPSYLAWFQLLIRHFLRMLWVLLLCPTLHPLLWRTTMMDLLRVQCSRLRLPQHLLPVQLLHLDFLWRWPLQLNLLLRQEQHYKMGLENQSYIPMALYAMPSCLLLVNRIIYRKLFRFHIERLPWILSMVHL